MATRHNTVIRASEQSQQAGDRLAIQIEMRNWDRCRAIIDTLERGEELTEERDVLDTEMSLLVSTRTANSLEYIGITRLRHALFTTDEMLLTAPNFGKSGLAEVKAAARKILGRESA